MNNRRNQLMLASAREYCKCVVEGKTIKYNQLLVEGNFPTTNSWYSNGLTANVTNNVLSVYCTTAYQSVYNPNSLVEGHKYLFCLWARNLNGIPSFAFGWYSGYSTDIPITTDWQLYACVTPPVASGSDYAYIYPRGVGSAEFKKYQIIDLTELGLDNINSVADFYATDLGKYIRKGNYLETTSGAFIQAKTPINFKGVNIWNEQWENCYYHEGQNGQKVERNGTVGCKDKIKVSPSTHYYFSSITPYYFYVLFYDKNGDYLSNYVTNYGNKEFSTPNNCEFITFYIANSTYNHDICISENAWDENWELVNSKLTSKSPIKVFEGATYFITAPLLWGIFESDASGNMGNGIETYSVSGGYRFKIPKNCHYIMFNMASSYGSTYNNDIAIFYVGYQKYCGRTGKVFVIDYNQQIKNGNFATTDDWTCSGGTMSVLNNELTITITERSSQNNLSTNIKLNTGNDYHKLYVSFDLVQDLGDNGSLIFGSPVNDRINDIPCGYTVTRHRYIKAINNANGTIPISLYFCNYANLSVGQNVKVSNFMIIDLTEIYGVGNEPSTVSDFNNTDLGQLIAEKGYLPYSPRNVGYALGKQLQKGDYYKTYGVDKVSYNQNAYNGDFALNEGWRAENGTITISNNCAIVKNNASGGVWCYGGLSGSNYMQKDHKYLLKATVKPSTNATIWFVYNGQFYTFIAHSVNANQLTEISEIGVFSETPVSSGYLVGVRCANGVSDINDTLEVSNVMVIDLTALGLGDITTIEEFYRTPLGMLVKKGYYLNYTTSNKTIKPQLIRTMKEIDMEDLNWQSEEFGYYALLPSDCKKVESNEIPNLLATNYKITSAESSQSMEIKIDDIWGIGWCFAIQGLYNEPTGKLMYELNTPIIVDEEIEDIMVSRRTIGVESDNGIDLDFTKE